MSAFEEISKAHDQIFLVLPDGREVIGKALVVCEPVRWPGGPGAMQSQIALDAIIGAEPMECCVVLMKLDKPIRERIILG